MLNYGVVTGRWAGYSPAWSFIRSRRHKEIRRFFWTINYSDLLVSCSKGSGLRNNMREPVL
jgi:hypothetical protein